MNKEEFLRKLESKLAVLDEKEVKDILDEYSEHIDEKMKKGIPEEKAIEEFGSINELASDILEAYKVNKNYTKNNDDFFTDIVDTCRNVFDKMIKILSHGSSKDIFNIIIYILVIALVLLVIRIPFEIVASFFTEIVSDFSGAIQRVFNIFISLFINLSYVLLAFFIFVKMLGEKLGSEVGFEYLDEKEAEMKEKDKKTSKKSLEKEDNFKEEKPREKVVYKSGSDALGRLIKTIIKIFVGLFSIPMFFTLIGIVIAAAILLEFSSSYFALFGSVIALAGIIIGLILFLEIMFRFMFDKKISFKRTFITLIISLMAFGFGVGYGTYELAKLDFIDYDKNYKYKETFEYRTESEYIELYCYSCESMYKDDVIQIDNSLNDNEIKLEVEYSLEYLNVRSNVSSGHSYFDYENDDDFYRNSGNRSESNYYSVSIYPRVRFKHALDDFLSNLKKGTVYNYDDEEFFRLKVFVNENTAKKITLIG